ncbi:hypothetical protein [Parvularcula sp. IMCC14364]|uniref:hypothetical protein n=1 Tax=Parvularcula sp. IMCC14364 TaxID=3067902 RepID=UPI002740EBF5|nr:hypothetical protein [Parvularcula sp. IMCC14364]
MLKKIVPLMCLLLFAGCETTTVDYLTVASYPEEVLLKFGDGTTCTTPCPLYVQENLTMTVAKAGYIAQEWTLLEGQTGFLQIELELAAPTSEVEETALPDI